ncbi:hypothetical protein Agabi119p4_5178 [Agaricus bisporus var. burnettii]|uniref:Uncharacterized protein n=1 Tax=Agaricus bisporus var. burnettii TaxID=192524 RepID=A0A8H7F4T0_AGABI|nr:hypothetical protein Agabi119p4_5178 [Agaricus bisporus var. burnettii]
MRLYYPIYTFRLLTWTKQLAETVHLSSSHLLGTWSIPLDPWNNSLTLDLGKNRPEPLRYNAALRYRGPTSNPQTASQILLYVPTMCP